jgi:NAD(P)-dependent dehydrogenase (short-subunit alcohol dehydrogenase family)
MREVGANMLRGKVVAVTGGSGGIGEAIAKLMAEHGACVVVNDLPGEDVTEVVKEIEAAGGEAVGCTADVATTEGTDALVRITVSTFLDAKRRAKQALLEAVNESEPLGTVR